MTAARRGRGARAGAGSGRFAGPAVALILTASLILAACAELRPNLLEVYPQARYLPRHPVIILPGAFGSRLKDDRTGEVVWGRFTNLLTSRFKLILNPLRATGTDLLDLPIDSTDITANRDHLVAYSLFDEVAGRQFYRRIVQTLTQVAGYRFGDIEDPHRGEDCFAFHYDWRRDIVENARLLERAIERIRRVQPDPRTRVDLIAHSLGGLISRYYVKYGGSDVLDGEPKGAAPGADHIGTVVMIGVPNEGSLDSLRSLDEGVRLVRRLPSEALFTMPSAYQTLPHHVASPFIDAQGSPLEIDLYDAGIWERYGWSAFQPKRLAVLRREFERQFDRAEAKDRYEARLALMRAYLAAALDRAGRLQRALDAPVGAEAAVSYFAFGGDCTPTPARSMILEEDGAFRTITHLDDVPDKLRTPEVERLMSEPGDGSVTRASLLGRHHQSGDGRSGLPVDYTLFLCETHRNLTENVTFQDNLLQFLLYQRDGRPGERVSPRETSSPDGEDTPGAC
ncbi:MAG TPA: hypothetical protein VFP98_04085 [Candidatus Polarisedimenticolia bacterium]|nr:hypothetical protein [Candidatus Polarisedimenticolia bacterium]